MKRTLKKIFKGFSEGSIGIDLSIFDNNNDGKVTWREVKKAGLDKWIKFLTSLGTTIGTLLLIF